MFAVIFEAQPRPEAWDDYLSHAAALRPELQAIDGFIANQRYASLSRPGWLVSLSIWHNEKALVRWRTHALHHDIQGKGRSAVLADYHLRVGEIVVDTDASQPLRQQRFDTTEVSAMTAATVTERSRDGGPVIAGPDADTFDSITQPGNALYLRAWRDLASAQAGIAGTPGRHRVVRIIRDYGMFARAEAPQHFPAQKLPA